MILEKDQRKYMEDLYLHTSIDGLPMFIQSSAHALNIVYVLIEAQSVSTTSLEFYCFLAIF